MNYFDLHCDTLLKMYNNNLAFYDEKLSVNSRFSTDFENWYQCFAVFIDDKTAEPFLLYKKLHNLYKNELKSKFLQNPTPVLTIENGKVIEDNIGRLELLKNDGVFSFGLTWNNENLIAGGVDSTAPLKPFGKEVIRELNNLKIATDLSHLNKESFYKAVELADYPIVSHICINNVFVHKRNIDINAAKLVAEKGGIIGICFYPQFLGNNDTFEDIYKHIYFCLEKGLKNNISIGSDFDGCNTDINIGNIGKLYSFLQKKNIDKITLDNIFYKNAFNYFYSLTN
ncbi:MAG: dipeptidase [Clostridia bacterium]|nr:dipeptidase [Clostridia bacterium]